MVFSPVEVRQVRYPGKWEGCCPTPDFPEIWRAQVNLYCPRCRHRVAWWRRTSAEFFLDTDQLQELEGPWEDGAIHLSNRSSLVAVEGPKSVLGTDVDLMTELSYGPGDGSPIGVRATIRGPDGTEIVRVGQLKFWLQADESSILKFRCGHCRTSCVPLSLEDLRARMTTAGRVRLD